MAKIKKRYIVLLLVIIVIAANYYGNKRMADSAPIISRETITLSNGKLSEVIKRDYSGYRGVIYGSGPMPATFYNNISEAAEHADHIVKGIYHDDARLIDSSGISLPHNTASTFEVTEVLKGGLSVGNKIELSERYYIDKSQKTIWHHWNSYPADPGMEYLVFLISPYNNGRYYNIMGLNGQGTARFPIVDTTEPVDIITMSDTDLNLGPVTSSANYRHFFAEVIEQYFGGSISEQSVLLGHLPPPEPEPEPEPEPARVITYKPKVNNKSNTELQMNDHIEELDISEITDAEVVNAAWKDLDSIYFVARKRLQEPNEADKSEIKWEQYPITVYRYDFASQKLEKAFEYISEEHYDELDIQILNNGNIALKHYKGFIIASGEDHSIVEEIDLPPVCHYKPFNLSYDGSKVAVANTQTNCLEVREVDNLGYSTGVMLGSSKILGEPVWMTVNNRLIFMANNGGSVATRLFRYDADTNDGYERYNFKGHELECDIMAYLVDNGDAAYRIDSISLPNDKIKLQFEKYDFATKQTTLWEVEAPAPLYQKSISEKGYLIGHISDNGNQLYIADLNNKKLVVIDDEFVGEMQVSPIWARDQKKAIVFLKSVNTADDGWEAYIIDCESILK